MQGAAPGRMPRLWRGFLVRAGLNMTITIPDNILKDAGLTEREALVELASRLFDIGRLALWPAAQLAGLSRAEFEEELEKRGLAAYRPTVEDLHEDLENLRQL